MLLTPSWTPPRMTLTPPGPLPTVYTNQRLVVFLQVLDVRFLLIGNATSRPLAGRLCGDLQLARGAPAPHTIHSVSPLALPDSTCSMRPSRVLSKSRAGNRSAGGFVTHILIN